MQNQFLTFPPFDLYNKVNSRRNCIDLLHCLKSFISDNHSSTDLSGTHPFLNTPYPKELARGSRGYKQMLLDLDRALADSDPEAITSSVDDVEYSDSDFYKFFQNACSFQQS
jgi:hypothetical protein